MNDAAIAEEIAREAEEEKKTLETLKAANVSIPEGTYGYRQCLQCGKWFTPPHFAQLCCSEECRKERNRSKSRKSAVNQMTRLKKRLAMLEEELAKARGQVATESAADDCNASEAGNAAESGNQAEGAAENAADNTADKATDKATGKATGKAAGKTVGKTPANARPKARAAQA